MKINVVLFQPEIPQNTGNISRTCSATASALHLVHPLGFSLDERHLRRAGLDYWDGLEIHQYPSTAAFLTACAGAPILYFSQKGPRSLWDIDIPAFISTKVDAPVQGPSAQSPSPNPEGPTSTTESPQEIFLAFGRESRGLDNEILEANKDSVVRIPMLEGKRSLNLSNSVAIAVYEVLRQCGFEGLKTQGALADSSSNERGQR